MTSTPWRPLVPRSLFLGLLLVLCWASGAIARDGPVQRLYPVGGGYEEALKGYSVEVARTARGPAVRMVMVPAAFAEDPPLPDDEILLAEDVEALRLACEAVIDRIVFPSGCAVSSVPLFVAGDACDTRILARLADPRCTASSSPAATRAMPRASLVVRNGLARAVGAQPVVVLDGRNATFFDGSNGALGALNVLLDVYEPGDTLPP